MSKSRHVTTPTPLTAARDRGPSRYFHGRKRSQRNFKELLQRAAQAGNGTTFLVQGAPGVGKTALVYECKKHALEDGWDVASITPLALWDSDELRYALGRGSRLSVTGGSGKVGVDSVVKIEASLDFSVDQETRTVLQVLRDGKKPLLLALDEAQALSKRNIPPPGQEGIVNSVLNSIHNGVLDRPVILLAAGLGATLKGFGSLGISRFAAGCVVELGPLSKEEERTVIRDWIKKESGAKGDPTAWIDAIALETHGWAQHIQAYANCAAEQLKVDNGVMTPGGLSSTLRAGREARKEYYKQQANKFYGDELQCLMSALPDNPSAPPASRIDIMSALTKIYDLEAKTVFDRFISKGILETSGVGLVVPIPSMHAWLKDTYGRERIEIPPAPTMGQSFIERDSGRER